MGQYTISLDWFDARIAGVAMLVAQLGLAAIIASDREDRQ